jgi:hypothetical protein
MTIKFFTVTPNIKTNGDALAEGVCGVSCLEARKSTFGERMDYTPFLPAGCGLSSVEVYANGARNFFVKNEDNKTVGYLIIRPLVNVDVENPIDNYDVD